MPGSRPFIGIVTALLIVALGVALVAAQDVVEEEDPLAPVAQETPADVTPVPEDMPPADVPLETPPSDLVPPPVEPSLAPEPTADPGAIPALPPTIIDLSIIDFSYEPADATAVAGVTLRWSNYGASSHTVTSTTGLFQSRVLPFGADFTVLIAVPGDYAYFCEIHPDMQGVVHLTEPLFVPTPIPPTPTAAQATRTPIPPSSTAASPTVTPTPTNAADADATATAEAIPTTSPTRGVARTATPRPTQRPTAGPAGAASPTVGSTGPMTASVEMVDSCAGDPCNGGFFRPPQVEVARGGTVTWTNRGRAQHNVSSSEFSTGNFGPGVSRSSTFNRAGTFAYRCSIHPGSMNGTVIVN